MAWVAGQPGIEHPTHGRMRDSMSATRAALRAVAPMRTGRVLIPHLRSAKRRTGGHPPVAFCEPGPRQLGSTPSRRPRRNARPGTWWWNGPPRRRGAAGSAGREGERVVHHQQRAASRHACATAAMSTDSSGLVGVSTTPRRARSARFADGAGVPVHRVVAHRQRDRTLSNRR
jgi:hypothetical protein